MAMRAGFAYYRAIRRDVADNKAIIDRFKLPMPVLASYPHGRGRGSAAEQSLKRVVRSRSDRLSRRTSKDAVYRERGQTCYRARASNSDWPSVRLPWCSPAAAAAD
jgi:hypothetical protein